MYVTLPCVFDLALVTHRALRLIIVFQPYILTPQLLPLLGECPFFIRITQQMEKRTDSPFHKSA